VLVSILMLSSEILLSDVKVLLVAAVLVLLSLILNTGLSSRI